MKLYHNRYNIIIIIAGINVFIQSSMFTNKRPINEWVANQTQLNKNTFHDVRASIIKFDNKHKVRNFKLTWCDWILFLFSQG